jgi:DNA-binding response OmpR family regulator
MARESYSSAGFFSRHRIFGFAMNASSEKSPGIPGSLPPQLKVLSITTTGQTGSWLAAAFAADSATQVALTEVVGVTAGLTWLRDEEFDAVLIHHVPDQLDALDLVEGLRAGGSETPMIILGVQLPQEIDALCYEVGADDYCCVAETTVRGLLWKFSRAIERNHLVRENRRLLQVQQQRLKQEHLEAQRLLEQQRQVIADLESLGKPALTEMTVGVEGLDDCLAKSIRTSVSTTCDLPASLVSHYRELLRTYVIMGVGNLSGEMARLAEMLATSEVSAQRALQLHVAVLEELVQGLGTRSARHVMNRADLLALEVMGHLADGYRARLYEGRHPLRQQILPFAA